MDQRSQTSLREELKELRDLRCRGIAYRWTVISGYTAIALSGGVLAAWALREGTVWAGEMTGIAIFALMMGWPAILRRPLDLLFYGKRPRLAGEFVETRIDIIEFELMSRRRLGD